ncbi:MAG: SH3 domain-containing protein [Proteobacteria bacterium]|nr:SH3 domain-containing protein [Pseudomonadota bacterium]
MDERQNLRKRQYSTIIGIIALILIPVTTSFQYGLIDLLYAEQVGSVKAKLSSSTGRQKLTSTKITCLQIIQEDYEGLKISYPSEVFVEPVKKEIYVLDTGNSRILIYASDFYPLFSIDSTYGVESPVGLAIDSEGYLFIAQAKSKGNKKGRISILNPSLGWEKDIYFEGFEGADSFGPSNIAISKRGYLYVTGSSYRGVVVLDKDGAFSHLLTPVDSLGKSPEEKATICDVDIDNQGNIYLLSEDMGRIYVYDSQDRYLFKFGQKGGSSGKLSRPRGIAVDSAGERIYVIDYMRHTASAYSNDGQFLFEFGGKGWGKGWFNYPTDIAMDTLGNILVVDTFNNRVQVLKVQEIPSIEKAKEPKPKVTIAKKVSEAKIPEYYLLTSNMNLREESNTDSNIIRVLRKGEEFQILDEYKQDDLNTWLLIKSKADLKGWICGIYRGKSMFKEKIEAKAKPAEVETVEEVKAPKPSVSVAKEVSEPESEKYYILISNMNLREESNTDSRIKLLMKEGEEFQILDEYKQDNLNTWHFIKSKSDLKGWICGIYRGKNMFKEKLEVKAKPAEVEITKYYILTSNMNLREESNTDSRIKLLMKEGEEFQILDEHKRGELYHWYYIETRSGLKGWFCGIYKGEVRFEKTVNREP